MQRRGKRGIAAGAVALAVVAATFGVGWPAVAAADRGAVTLHEDAKPWDCASGAVTVSGSSGSSDSSDSADDAAEQQTYSSLVTVTKSLDCRLRLVVSNGSGQRVTVTGLTLPLLGHANAMPVDAVQLDGDFTTERPTGGHDDADARFRIRDGLTIEPHSSAILVATVRYVHKSKSCALSAGTSVSDFTPVIEVTARGISGRVSDTTSTFGFAAPQRTCI